MSTFKNVKSKGKVRRRFSNEEEEISDSTLDAIQLTKKKQKLIKATLYKKGLDAEKTLKPEKTIVPKDEYFPVNDCSSNLFKTTFSSVENGPTETVMQKKHHSAMEEFINKRLHSEKQKNVHDSIDTHIEESISATEADMGAGGTLLGGTGIAEVILPLETRLETVMKTEELRTKVSLSNESKKISSAAFQDDEDLFSEKRQILQSTTFRQFKTNRQQSLPNARDTETVSHLPDAARTGFQANRNPKLKVSSQTLQKGNDDRVLKDFIRRERARR
jgi:hypothetical protein